MNTNSQQFAELVAQFARRFPRSDNPMAVDAAIRDSNHPFWVDVRKHFAIQKKFVINGDTEPSEPRGLTVVRHRSNGRFVWDPFRVACYVAPRQLDKGGMAGAELQLYLRDKRILNAAVLEHLLLHQELIPESWMEMTVHFWGTVYTQDDGTFCVRAMWYDLPRGRYNETLAVFCPRSDEPTDWQRFGKTDSAAIFVP